MEQVAKEIAEVEKLRISGDAYKGGFKVRLTVEGYQGLTMSLDCKFRKVKPRQMAVVERRGPRGGRVEGRYEGGKKYYEVLEDGSRYEIGEDEVRYVQVMPNGEEVEVNPLPRFKELRVVKAIPRTMVEDFIYESVYELWSMEDNVRLWKLAEKLIERDEALVALYSFGGFKAYTAVIYPIVKAVDGSRYFIMAVLMCSAKKEWRAWMPTDRPIKEKRAAKKRKEGLPTVQTQLLV